MFQIFVTHFICASKQEILIEVLESNNVFEYFPLGERERERERDDICTPKYRNC